MGLRGGFKKFWFLNLLLLNASSGSIFKKSLFCNCFWVPSQRSQPSLVISLKISLSQATSGQHKVAFSRPTFNLKSTQHVALASIKPQGLGRVGTPRTWRGPQVLLFKVSGIWGLLSQCLLNEPKKFWLCCLPAVSAQANAFTSLSFDFYLWQNVDNDYNSPFTGLLLKLDELIALESTLTVKNYPMQWNKCRDKDVGTQMSNCDLVRLKII